MEISDLSETIFLVADMPMYEEYRGGMCVLVTTGCPAASLVTIKCLWKRIGSCSEKKGLF